MYQAKSKKIINDLDQDFENDISEQVNINEEKAQHLLVPLTGEILRSSKYIFKICYREHIQM